VGNDGIRLVVNGRARQIGLDYLRSHDLRRTPPAPAREIAQSSKA
jgi:hypothetical protein